MSAAHTPGPWRVDPEYTGDIQTADGASEIAISWTARHAGAEHTNPTNVPADDEAKANARLIAAAPDLLSIAKRWAALDAGEWHPTRHANDKIELLDDTRAAILKATGGAA